MNSIQIVDLIPGPESVRFDHEDSYYTLHRFLNSINSCDSLGLLDALQENASNNRLNKSMINQFSQSFCEDLCSPNLQAYPEADLQFLMNVFFSFFEAIRPYYAIHPTVPIEHDKKTLSYLHKLISMGKDEGYNYRWDYAFLFVGFCCIIIYDNIPNTSASTSSLDTKFNIKNFSDSKRSIIENIRHAFVHARVDTEIGTDSVSLSNVSVYDTTHNELFTTTTKEDVVHGYIGCMKTIEQLLSNAPAIQSIKLLHNNIISIVHNQWQLLGFEPLFLSLCLMIIITDENKQHNRKLLFDSMRNLAKSVGFCLDTSKNQIMHIFGKPIDIHNLRNVLSHEALSIKNDSISFKIDRMSYNYNSFQLMRISNLVAIYHELPYVIIALFYYKNNLLQHFSSNTN